MKNFFLILSLLGGFAGFAQSKNEKEIIAQTYLLSHTVFGTKDSVTLERLFAREASYGHSHGKVQNRQEAIRGISGNTSTYTDTAVSNISVIFADDDEAITRYLFKATEHTEDGRTVPLNFNMMLVWVKEEGKWKLFGRQAVSIQ